MNYTKPRLPDDLPGIIARLRKAAENEGWNQANLVMELCNKAEEIHRIASSCLEYFEYMEARGSEFTPDFAWLAPLRTAVTGMPVGENK